jgi:hypothetical protein
VRPKGLGKLKKKNHLSFMLNSKRANMTSFQIVRIYKINLNYCSNSTFYNFSARNSSGRASTSLNVTELFS